MGLTREEFSKILGYGFAVGFSTGLTATFLLYGNWMGTILALFFVAWSVIYLNKAFKLDDLKAKSIDQYGLYGAKPQVRDLRDVS